jgi:hypothetical protein
MMPGVIFELSGTMDDDEKGARAGRNQKFQSLG